MKLELEVLASTSIKRKKPWPRLAWIGEVTESIFLVDAHRLSILYVPSGKTKRRVAKLQPLLEDVTALSHSDNGHFMVGLLKSGDAFLWHKDTDMLKYIQGLPELALSLPNASNNANRPCMPFDDGSKLAVVVNRSRVYVWEQDADQVLFAAKVVDVKGAWTEVRPNRAVSMPDPSACETAVSAVFFINDVLGLCCVVSLVFTVETSVCVTTAVLRWYEAQHVLTYSKPTFSAEWADMKYTLGDLVLGGVPVHAAGAYVTRPSHDGQLLAVALNQKSSSLNRIMFVSALTDTLVVADLKGTGARIPVTRGFRKYWMTDLAWTADDLFVIAMTRQGSVAMLTRLGEPVLLKTFGCSLDIGPRHFLPLHPLISVKTGAQNGAAGNSQQDEAAELEAQAAADYDPMRQRFSLSCHPRLPIFLCSDGYMVTALQLPPNLTCLSLMKGLVMESNHFLRRVRDQQKMSLTLYDSMRRQGRVTKKLSLSNGVAGGRRIAMSQIARSRHVHDSGNAYQFEEIDDDVLNHSLNDDNGEWDTDGGKMFGNFDILTGNMESGKLFFGDFENLMVNRAADVDVSDENLSAAQLIQRAQNTLLSAWSLGVSHSGLWTEEHEDVATNVAHNLVRLFTVLLQSSPDVFCELRINASLTAENDLSSDNGSEKNARKNPRLMHILHVLTSILHLLRLDAPQQHLMVCSMRFAHSTLRLLLTDPHLRKLEPHLNTLHGSFAFLTFVERVFSGVYTSIPKTSLVNSLPVNVQQELLGINEPPMLCEYRTEAYSKIPNDVLPRYEMSGMLPEQRKLIRPLPEQEDWMGFPPHRSDIVKRLGPAWRLLYKHAVSLYKSISSKKVKAKLRRSAYDLLVTVQVKLTSIGQGHLILPTKKRKVQPGCRLSIEGCSVPALKAWMYQLNMPQDAGSGRGRALGHLLLSTLYSLLLQDELRAAIELTELLLRQPDIRSAAATCRLDQAKKWSTLAMLQQDPGGTVPPRYIRCKAVRAVVRSVARIMAAYFSNRTLFVFPPHAPRIIPPLHKTYIIKSRVIPLYHESLSAVVRQDGLGGIWTVERVADYLLLSGLISEAAWFADALGDWKTAFMLGVAQSEHQRTHHSLYQKHKRKLEFPVSILPNTILQARLAHAFGLKVTSTGSLLVDEESDLPGLRRVLQDLMLAAVLSRVDLVPWLLEGLMSRLRTVAAQFPAVVPPGLYLPAPPIYCPQPANTSQAALSEDDAREVSRRHEASSLIQLMFLILEGANCTLPAARWYARRVYEAVNKGRRFRLADLTAEDGPDVPVLQASFLGAEPIPFCGRLDDPSVCRILAALRDLCALVWLFYARDKLSLGLRKKLQLVERKMKNSPVPTDPWLKHCQETLHWAAALVPFAHFLDADNDIFGITLSLITELPMDEHACQLLCQFFYNAESLDPELQDKLQAVLKDWQGVFIDPPARGDTGTAPRDTPRSPRGDPGKSPHGTSLSFYFHKQAQHMEKHFRRKAKVFGEYEVFVFDSESECEEADSVGRTLQDGLAFIGSRPFESEDAYLEFLDVFYAVSFHKCLDAEEKEAAPSLPLLSASSMAFREKELMSLAHKAVTSLHRKQQQQQQQLASSSRSSRHGMTRTDRSPTRISAMSRLRLPSSPRTRIGLFRSHSFNELSQKRSGSQLPLSSPIGAQKRKSSSHQDLSQISADEEEFLDVHAAKPRSVVGGGKGSPRSNLASSRGRHVGGRQLFASDTQLTIDSGIMPKMSLARRCMVRRSSSVNDVDDARKVREAAKSKSKNAANSRGGGLQLPVDDPLLNPVVAMGLLERLEFGESYAELEQLLEWLSRWAGRNHTLTTRPEHTVVVSTPPLSNSLLTLNLTHQGAPQKGCHDFSSSLKVAPLDVESNCSHQQKPVMRIKVHPRMVVYSLWLVENQYYNDPSLPTGNNSNLLPAEKTTSTNANAKPPTPASLSGGLDTTPLADHHDTLATHPTHHTANDGGVSDALEQPEAPRPLQEVPIPVPLGVPPAYPPPRAESDGEGDDEDQKELEESYRAQIISAESNESVSDGFIPAPKRKKMGILKKKKKVKKAEMRTKPSAVETIEVEKGPEVGTSDTLMRRLSFKLTEDGSQEPATSHNTSQVSDSTLNVSSLNDEELPGTIRQTLTCLDTTSNKTGTYKSIHQRMAEAQPAPSTPVGDDDINHRVELLTEPTNVQIPDEMAGTATTLPDTQFDLRPLDTPANPRAGEDPNELRCMVRQELRKIVEAQHRGILAMLGALGEEEDDVPLGASTPHDRHGGSHHRKQKHRRKKGTTVQGQPHQEPCQQEEQLALNGTDNASFNDPSSLTEVDITPLPSDETSLKSLDRPLTVSDLFKSKTWSPGVKFDPREVGNNVRGALRELKTLENSQSAPNHVRFDLQRQTLPSGKENVHAGGQGQDGQGHQGHQSQMPGQQQQSYLNQNQLRLSGFIQQQGNLQDTGQPFARVFHMLKQMNQNLSGNQQQTMGDYHSTGPPLLHMTGPGGSAQVWFPPIPGTEAPSTRGAPSGGSAGGMRMPLLHLYTPHHTDEVPVHDVTSHLPHVANLQSASNVPYRMPLLRMTTTPIQPRIFSHIEDEHGELQLVPAEDVIAFEKRRQEEIRRQKLEQRRSQMEALGLSGPPVEAVLKKVERRDQRQSERRKQRRQRAEEDDENVRTSRENLSSTIRLSQVTTASQDIGDDINEPPLEALSRHVQVDRPAMMTQEVQVSRTPTPRNQSTQGNQFPTPRSGSLEEEAEDESGEELDELHHGYALTPGLFDEYLGKDGELGSAQDSAARIHYRAIAGKKPRKLKEQCTGTEDGPGWRDEGTITCRDQGTDPVAEALSSYMQARGNLKASGFVAPDVFMGLAFSDETQTATAGPSAAKSNESGAPKHAFLSVVDLDEAALADIVTSLPDQDDEYPAHVITPRKKGEKRTPRGKSPGQRPRVETTHENQAVSEDEVTTGPDRVTSKVLSGRRPGAGGAVSHRARARNKDGIRDRLEDMDMQFEAIDAMSRNMEEDYKNARLMIHTIEQIGEAIQATPDIPQEEESPAYRGHTPRHRSPKQKPPGEAEEDAHSVHERASDINSHHRLSDNMDKPLDEEEQPCLEPAQQVEDPLSGVSHIIGEVIASGRVDTTGLGISNRQASKLANKASARSGVNTDGIQRGDLHQRLREKWEQDRIEKEREDLRVWMEEKRSTRLGDFKKRRQDLREQERHPYKPSKDQMSTLTMKEFEEWEQKRVLSKKQQELLNAEKRLREASELMGDILSEKPELPWAARTTSRPGSAPSRVSRKASISPVRHVAGQSPSRHPLHKKPGVVSREGPGRAMPRATAWDIPNEPDRMPINAGDYRNDRDSRDHNRHFQPEPAAQPEQAGSGLLNTQTGTSSAGLRAYTRHLEGVQSSVEPDSTLKAADHPVEEDSDAETLPPPPTVPAYKPTPFTETVRLQRPAITRENRPRSAAKPYVQRLSEMSETGDTPRSGTAADRRAQERLYGTKRIPGMQISRTTPRTVKTYQERLQEMKRARNVVQGPMRRYSGPIPATAPDGTTVIKPMTRPMRSIVKRKKKPQTYVEQLKSLQPPKDLNRTATVETPSMLMSRSMGRGRGRRGPAHKPMTYTQQLQALQPSKELFRTPPGAANYHKLQDSTISPRASYQQSVPQNALRRSGPYPSPYQPAEERERTGALSPWDMDDDLRRLIYDDATSSYVGASRTGTDFDISELQELAGLDDPYAYTDLVDVQQITDAASISDGSIMSFIDWDQVNDLIADIN